MVGALLLNRLYGHSQLGSVYTTSLVVVWLCHLTELLFDSEWLRRLKMLSLFSAALVLSLTLAIAYRALNVQGVQEYFIVTLVTAGLSLIPILRVRPEPEAPTL